MASGSLSGSIKNGAYTVRVDWYTQDDIAGNSSRVVATMYLVQSTYASLDIWSRECAIWINGTKYTFNSPYEISNSGGVTTKLGQVTSNSISHNADGSKSVKISAAFNIQATISGTYYNSIDVPEKTIALTTLPRSSAVSTNVSSVKAGNALTVSLARASSSFTHDITFSIGSRSTTVSGVGASTTWTVPKAWQDQFPSSPTATLTIVAVTKSGSTAIGTTSTTVTVVVSDDALPSLTATIEGVSLYWGLYIRTKSKAKITLSASGKYGASIKQYKISGGGYSSSSSTYTTGYLLQDGTNTFTCTVIDSRGLSSAIVKSIAVQAYDAPYVINPVVHRTNQEGTEQVNGTYIYAKAKRGYSSCGGNNSCTMAVQYREASGSYGSSTALSDDTAVILGDGAIVSNKFYVVKITVADNFTATSREFQIGTDKFRAAFGEDAVGLLRYPPDGGKGTYVTDLEASGMLFARGEIVTYGWITVGGSLDVRGSEIPEFFNTDSDTGGSEFFAWLEDIYARMPINSAKRIAFTDYPYISGSRMIGTIMKTDNNWGVVTLVSYEYHYKKIVIVKYNGTWGPIQYDNPPLIFGVEYCTTERYNGEIVYTKMLNLGSASNGKSVDTGHGKIFRHSGSLNENHSLPYGNYNVGWWANSYNEGAKLILTCSSGFNGYTWVERIWYRK